MRSKYTHNTTFGVSIASIFQIQYIFTCIFIFMAPINYSSFFTREKETKCWSGPCYLEGSGMDVFLSKAEWRTSNVVSVVLWITMGTSSRNVPFFLLYCCETVLSSLHLMNRERTNWSRCLLWHGWLPGSYRHARSVLLGLWLPVIWLVIIWRMPSDLIWKILTPLNP